MNFVKDHCVAGQQRIANSTIFGEGRTNLLGIKKLFS